jgi:DNA-binding transcriptional ArsR family regulator
MFTVKDIRKTSKILRVLGQPDRLQILLAIGEGEACVCHLKAVLKKRQAFISQHLMAMRDAKILETRRDGRFIYYQVRDKEIFNLIRLAGKLANIQEEDLLPADPGGKVTGCECPKCAGGVDPQLIQIAKSAQK